MEQLKKILVLVSVSILCINLQAQNMSGSRDNFKTYSYKGAGGFSISYPPNWVIQESPMSKVKLAMLGSTFSGLRTSINIISSTNATESIETVFQSEQNFNNNNRQIFNNYRLVKKEDVAINNTNGIQIIATWSINGVKIIGVQRILKSKNNTQYTITLTISASAEDREVRLSDDIIESFKAL
jgi:hypothetical protein